MNTEKKELDFRAHPHKLSNIAHIIAVVRGKGGVGKSLVTSMLASTMQKKGHACAILDADITGPSIPKAFGLTKKATGSCLGGAGLQGCEHGSPDEHPHPGVGGEPLLLPLS